MGHTLCPRRRAACEASSPEVLERSATLTPSSQLPRSGNREPSRATFADLVNGGLPVATVEERAHTLFQSANRADLAAAIASYGADGSASLFYAAALR
jgi:hypothetical protein